MDFSLMKSLLECPVCYTIPRNQSIFLCSNSHKICQTCFDLLELKICPQGKCEYKDEQPMRNRDLEKIIAECDIDLSCHNWREGCTVEAKKKELEEHETECDFRKVPCPFSCGSETMFRKIQDHLKESHRSTHFKGKGEFLSITWILKERHFSGNSKIFVNGVWENMDGQRFYCHLQKLDGKWISWICVEGGERTARKWKSKIKIKSKNADDNIEFEGNVFSIDCTKTELVSSGECFTMTDEEVRNLKNLNISNTDKLSGLWGKLFIEFSVENIIEKK